RGGHVRHRGGTLRVGYQCTLSRRSPSFKCSETGYLPGGPGSLPICIASSSNKLADGTSGRLTILLRWASNLIERPRGDAQAGFLPWAATPEDRQVYCRTHLNSHSRLQKGGNDVPGQ